MAAREKMQRPDPGELVATARELAATSRELQAEARSSVDRSLRVLAQVRARRQRCGADRTPLGEGSSEGDELR